MSKHLSASLVLFLGAAQAAWGQQKAPPRPDAPSISEAPPTGPDVGGSTAAAIDFNWVWLSLIVIALAFGAWYLARGSQKGR